MEWRMSDLLDRFRVDWSQEKPPEPPRLTPTFRDLVTGREAKSDHPASLYWWADGNGCCDCNREYAFKSVEEIEHEDTGYCLGAVRYIAIDVEADDGPIDGATKHALLAELNAGYKPAARHMLGWDV
jgi:hypothetical protein